MNYFEGYDRQLLLQFLNLKDTDPYKVLFIVGPYTSGKTTLKICIEEYLESKGTVVWRPSKQEAAVRVVNGTIPGTRCVMSIVPTLVDTEENIEQWYSYCRALFCGATISQMYSFNEMRVVGNQAFIVTVHEPAPKIQKDSHVSVLRLKELTCSFAERRLFCENGFRRKRFKEWITGLKEACEKAFFLLLLRKYRDSMLSTASKDLTRLIIYEVTAKCYVEYWQKPFDSKRITL